MHRKSLRLSWSHSGLRISPLTPRFPSPRRAASHPGSSDSDRILSQEASFHAKAPPVTLPIVGLKTSTITASRGRMVGIHRLHIQPSLGSPRRDSVGCLKHTAFTRVTTMAGSDGWQGMDLSFQGTGAWIHPLCRWLGLGALPPSAFQTRIAYGESTSCHPSFCQGHRVTKERDLSTWDQEANPPSGDGARHPAMSDPNDPKSRSGFSLIRQTRNHLGPQHERS